MWHCVFMFWLDSCMGPACGMVCSCFGWIAVWDMRVFMFRLDGSMGPACGMVCSCFGWIAVWDQLVAWCVHVLVG